MIELPFHEVAMQPTFYAALRLCMNNARPRLTDSQWSDHLGTTQGTFNYIVNHDRNVAKGRKHCPPEWINAVQQVARNYAITQWLDAEARGQLNHQRPELELSIEEKAAAFDKLMQSA